MHTPSLTLSLHTQCAQSERELHASVGRIAGAIKTALKEADPGLANTRARALWESSTLVQQARPPRLESRVMHRRVFFPFFFLSLDDDVFLGVRPLQAL